MIVRLLLFATAREAAGRGSDEFDLGDGATLDLLLDTAVNRYGEPFARVLGTARVWINGDDPGAEGVTAEQTVLRDDDEVAVLPPVSGGA